MVILKKCIILIIFIFTALPAESKTLVVGFTTGFLPFEFIGKGGELKGFDVDLWEAIASENGYKYKIKIYPFEKLIEKLVKKEIDLALSAITITAEREKLVDFSHQYFEGTLGILVRKGNENIRGLEDLCGKVVGIKRNTTSEDYLDKSLGLEALKKYNGTGNLFMAVSTGEIDAVFGDSAPLMFYENNLGKGRVKVVDRVYSKEPYGIAFPQGSKLREKVSITILQLMENGKYDEIHEKWFGVSNGNLN